MRRVMCEMHHVNGGALGGRCGFMVYVDKTVSSAKKKCGAPVIVEPEVRWCRCRRGILMGGWCSFCGRPDPSGVGQPTPELSGGEPRVRGPQIGSSEPVRRSARLSLDERIASAERRRARDRDRKAREYAEQSR